MLDRWIQGRLREELRKPFVHILFGARQTGKSTLLSHLLPEPALHYNLADPEERSRLLAGPGLFRRECEALPAAAKPHVVFVDVLSTPRFLLFDLGIRHAAAGVRPGRDAARADPGRCFEQWVMLELWKRLQYLGAGQISYYRTRGGREIDLIVERPDGTIVPVEVKWTTRPTPGDARHVETFVREQAAAAEGFVVCRCPRPLRLTPHVTAIPWFAL